MALTTHKRDSYLWPHTPLGWWSVKFVGAFAVLMTVFFLAVALGQRGGDEFFDNLWLTVPILAAWGAGLAAAAAGILAIAAHHERSPLVFGSTVLGLLIIAFSVAEVVFPH